MMVGATLFRWGVGREGLKRVCRADGTESAVVAGCKWLGAGVTWLGAEFEDGTEMGEES